MNLITFEFENAQAAHDFMGWWLDGGGEQDGGYNSKVHAFQYLIVKKSVDEDEEF